jgi:hypothetical protein
MSYLYSSKDIFYGQLAGMLETLTAGTTTVVDHAHLTISPDHAKLGIAATASSGIRSVFCYTPIMRVKHFNPLTYHPNPMEDCKFSPGYGSYTCGALGTLCTVSEADSDLEPF